MLKRVVLAGALAAVCATAGVAQDSARYDSAFRDATAVWHMTGLKDAAGKNELKVVGAVKMGTRLMGRERDESLAAGSDGVVADFDGNTFVQETEQMPCDHGPNFYATMSWGDIEGAPGRRVQLAWMRGGQYPDMPFNQQMSFPCDMTLRTTPVGLRIYRNPAPEISKLHGKPQTWHDTVLSPETSLPLASSGDLFHIKAQVEIPAGGIVTFHLNGTTITLTDHTAACNSQPAAVRGSVQTVEILLDRTSVETFVNDGEVSISTCFLPTGDKLTVEATQGSATLHSLQVFPLHSVWRGKSEVVGDYGIEIPR